MLNKINESDIYIINVLRGICALLVVANHLRSAIFVPFGDLEFKAGHLFYFLTSLGHQSVIVFFVISGYLVGGGVLNKGNQFIWQEYLISRFIRLYIVLVPALILTFIVDYCTKILNPDIFVGNYFEIFHSGPNEPVDSSMYALAINLLFMQDILGPIFGSNTPLWSLAYEFQFYLMFPALLVIIGKVEKPFFVKIILFVVLMLMIVFYSKDLFKYFPIWILGAISSRYVAKNFKPWLAVLSFVIFAVALIVPKIPFFISSTILNDYILALASTLLIYSMRSSKVNIFNGKIILLAEMSFTLYLMHFPIVLLIAAFMNYNANFIPGVISYVIFFIWLSGILMMSRFLWFIFERRTSALRSYVRFRLIKS